MWAFKQLYDKGLAYQGYLPYMSQGSSYPQIIPLLSGPQMLMNPEFSMHGSDQGKILRDGREVRLCLIR